MEVSDQLANLGAMISGEIQKSVQKNQFQAALPVMQDIFKQSMTDFDAGRSGEGFSKIMGVAMQFPDNPLIQNISQMAFTAGKAASDDYLSRRRITDKTTSGLTEDELEAFNDFGLPGVGGGAGVDAGAGGGAGGGGGTDAELEAGMLPEGTILNEDNSATLPDGRTIPNGQLPDALPTQPDMSQPLAEVDGAYQLQTGEQIVETPFFQDLGIDISAVVGPKKYSASIPKGTTESRTVGRKGLTATKSQQTEVVEKNTEEENEFKSLIDKARSATSSIKSNAQLKKIFSKAGNDFTNIETDEEEDGLGKTTYKAFVTASDGTQSEEELSKSEYDSLKVFTDEIPSYSSRTGVKIIKARKEEAAPAPAGGGLPAVQAQAPAAPATAAMPTAPDNPFAAPAEKETTARAETTEKKTKEARKTEIKRLTEQMQRLAPPQTVSLMALETGGAQGMPGVMQDPAQQAKLKQQYDELYYRRDKLVAVDEGRVFATKEEAKASKKKFTSGTIIYVGGIPAKVK